MKGFVGTCLLIYLNFNYSLQLGMAKHRPKSFEFTINKIPTDLQRLSGPRILQRTLYKDVIKYV
jgi:hypothetical protein